MVVSRWLRRSALALICGAALSSAPSTGRAQEVGEEDDPRPQVKAARAAYNDGRYQAAARTFLEAAQAYPKDAALVRNLARARMYAKDAAGAVIAYKVYLVMAPEADDVDKIQAEMELASRQAGEMPDDPLAKPRRVLQAARDRAQVGRFAGPDGAFKAIEDALEQGFFGPELAQRRVEVASALIDHSDAALDRWWRPEAQARPKALKAIVAGWAALRERRKLDGGEAGRASAVAGLLALASHDDEAALKALTPVAPSDPRMRYAQALVLARLGRLGEARALLETLDRQASSPQVSLLLGWVQRAEGQDAREALRAALGL